MATVSTPAAGTGTGARTFSAFVDDATGLLVGAAPDAAPGVVSLHEATAVFSSRAAPEVGTFVLRDTDVPLVRGFGGPLAVVVTGGAGQVAGPAALCRRLGLDLVRLHVALRDLADPAGNARRVIAAVDDARTSGELDEATSVHVELPSSGSETAWLAAADEVAACEHRLTLPTRDVEAATLVRWIDAALDRETPFSCSGLRRVVPGADRHGFLNVLVATGLLFDGQADPVGALTDTWASALLDRGVDLARARRWFTSFTSADVEASVHDLVALDRGGLDQAGLDQAGADS